MIGLKTVPHYSTLQKTSKRLRDIISQRLLAVMAIYANPSNMTVAADSTGFATGHETSYRVSVYKVERSFTKVTAACDVYTHLIIAQVTVHGPMNDARIFPKILEKIKSLGIKNILLDICYDSETIHKMIRDCNIK